MKKYLAHLSLMLFFAFSTARASATEKCANLFKDHVPQSAAVRKLVISDAYMQWLLWEQKANMAKFQKPTTTIDMPVSEISADDVVLVKSRHAPLELIRSFLPGNGKALWAKHPFNRWWRVPYFNTPASSTIPVYMTSSRSLALTGKLRGFTMKVATDHPHGPDGEWQPMKVKIKDDIDSAMINSNLLERADREMGEDPKLIMLGEVMTLADKKSGYGMVIRDVRKLDDGNYYLPAFAIPYAGHEIAKLNGSTFNEFFGEHYAALLGEAKARLLLRTGLQMLTPNPQNMLIQFDRNLKPTGKIVFRDISDAYLVDAVASGLGFQEQIASHTEAGYPPKTSLQPGWWKSAWRLTRSNFFTRLLPWGAADKGVEAASPETAKQWGRIHNQAYVRYLEKELGISFGLDLEGKVQDELKPVYEVLKSGFGQEKLQQYRQRMLNSSSVKSS